MLTSYISYIIIMISFGVVINKKEADYMSLLAILKSINLMLRFLLELVSLFFMGYWGYKTGNGPVQWVLAIGAPLIMAVIWGAMGAPKAAIQLSAPLHLVLEIIVFGLPVLLFGAVGKTEIAWIFGCLLIVNRILIYIWKQ
ncbi:YrdB family protein [Bacillus sp. MUM 116]|uniref:YrdB family protein n=1 Tax=Bacillus sp. MUM 116 TaxID=1678002 RepID=UPI0009F60CA5|nr:YrdB family protein [Bacillus sp. MUM 116]